MCANSVYARHSLCKCQNTQLINIAFPTPLSRRALKSPVGFGAIGRGKCGSGASAYVHTRIYTREIVNKRSRTKPRRDAHPLGRNNVTRLPVRHWHVHAPNGFDPTRVVSQPLLYFSPILTDSQLRKRSWHYGPSLF